MKCYECIGFIETHAGFGGYMNQTLKYKSKASVMKTLKNRLKKAGEAVTVVDGKALCVDHLLANEDEHYAPEDE